MNKPRTTLLLLLLFGACRPDTPVEQPAPPADAPLAATAVAADTLATYSWEGESCTYTGRYDSRRYSRQELDNVRQLLFGLTMLNTKTDVYEPAQLGDANLDTLTAEYTRQIQRYYTMRVLPYPLWRTLKEQAIREVEDDYRVHKVYVQAFAHPGVLLAASPGACKKYIEGLAAGNDSLTLQNWRRFVEEQTQLSGSSAPYTERYNRNLKSPDHLLHAKVELLSFGWFNCRNAAVRRVQRTAEMYRQFDALFVGITSECDDVD